MKIVVVTPYDSSNYGAFLQAYCLKSQLENMGHTVVHIPTRDADYVRSLYYRDKPRLKKEKLLRWKFEAKKRFGKQEYALFLEDQKAFNVADADSNDADLYILGSDEIWNINQATFRKDVFWGIGMSPVISYAASIGGASVDKFEKYPEQVNAVRKLSTALVRDVRTKQFVEKYCDTQANIVCDPTMLLPVADYGREFSDEYITKNQCLLIYAYSLKKNEVKAIREYAKANNLKVVSCCFYHDWCDYQCKCSPLEFSSLIRQCKAVITTTFHGTVFSILNHANFLSLPTSPKTTQLLSQFSLDNRYITPGDITPEGISKVLNGSAIDYDKVERKIKEIRENSIEQLELAIKNATSKSPNFDWQICKSDDCTGCFACMNKCPKQAIDCVTDLQGRTLPQIDPSKCVKCGLCKSVCPVNTPVTLNQPLDCYAAQRPDEIARKNSSSGGIGAVLSEEFIKSNGAVYGAVVGENMQVVHACAQTLEDIEKFKGSKYVQSYIGNIYCDVLSHLTNNKKVLFTGTPCQIAGLRNFLNKDYDNLYCVDLICHGTPPMQYLNEHIKSVAGENADFVSFRGGDRDFMIKIKSGGKEIYSKFKDEDAYYTAFFGLLTHRENCYSCRYAQTQRCGDITIGDFWGIDRQTLKTDQKGRISVVLVNTEKGKDLFDAIKDNLVFEERDLKEAADGNDQLRYPSVRHKNRTDFINKYELTGDFEKSVLSCGVEDQIKAYKRSRSIPYRAVRKFKWLFFK